MPALVPPVADERSGLTGYLAHQRHAVRVAAYGLTDDQARTAASASPLTVGGLIKHLTNVELRWTDIVARRTEQDRRAATDHAGQFLMGSDETLADLLARYADAAAQTDAVIAGIADLDRPVPVPPGVPFFPRDGSSWSVRWVLLQLIHETARHAGHADIIRESLDGATAFELMAAAENWPPTLGVDPWQPPGTSS